MQNASMNGSLTQSPAWTALTEHARQTAEQKIWDLFKQDPQRGPRYSISAAHWLLDYSKNSITDETMDLLLDLARQAEVEAWRERQFQGEKINNTEQRAVLHTALRSPAGSTVEVDGQDVMPSVLAMREKMRSFSESVRTGEWQGYSGQRITDVVNIGIGGSDLGPKMVCKALHDYAQTGLQMRFVSNLDGAHIQRTLQACNAASTLFIISSKSFTTQETLNNAKIARAWYLEQGGDEQQIARHFVAVTANKEKATAFGIAAEAQFSMWDWVGGRYSLWSAIGLPIAISIGMDGFEALLEGAYAMDEHFRSAPLAENMPVILALLGVWYNNFLDLPTYAVLPYSQPLASLRDYLQQADMESNGKSVDRDGHDIDYRTGPVVWGGVGTNAQHAFLQLMQQGTMKVPADFILFENTHTPYQEQHRMLLANGLAQMESLMHGKRQEQAAQQLADKGYSESECSRLAPYMKFTGNHPTNALLADTLTPQTLGALIALYEHKIFVQGVIWNINPYDQYGVEYGKQMAATVLQALSGNTDKNVQISSSTQAIIDRLTQ